MVVRDARLRDAALGGQIEGMYFPDADLMKPVLTRLRDYIDEDTCKDIFSYVSRQRRIHPDRSENDILEDMIRLPEGQPEYLHAGNFAHEYAEKAVDLIAERVVEANMFGWPSDVKAASKRLKRGLVVYQTFVKTSMETLLKHPNCIEYIDFRTDRRMPDSENSSVRRIFSSALEIRGKNPEQLSPKDRPLFEALNKIPFPSIGNDDRALIKGLLDAHKSRNARIA